MQMFDVSMCFSFIKIFVNAIVFVYKMLIINLLSINNRLNKQTTYFGD